MEGDIDEVYLPTRDGTVSVSWKRRRRAGNGGVVC